MPNPERRFTPTATPAEVKPSSPVTGTEGEGQSTPATPQEPNEEKFDKVFPYVREEER